MCVANGKTLATSTYKSGARAYRPTAKPVAVDLSTRLRRRLAETGLSQSELARRVGVRQSTIYALLAGDSHGSKHLHLIARELGTTPAYLTGETDDPSAETVLPDLTYDQRQLLACFEAMDETDRQMLLAMAMRLAERSSPGRVHARFQDYSAEPTAG